VTVASGQLRHLVDGRLQLLVGDPDELAVDHGRRTRSACSRPAPSGSAPSVKRTAASISTARIRAPTSGPRGPCRGCRRCPLDTIGPTRTGLPSCFADGRPRAPGRSRPSGRAARRDVVAGRRVGRRRGEGHDQVAHREVGLQPAARADPQQLLDPELDELLDHDRGRRASHPARLDRDGLAAEVPVYPSIPRSEFRWTTSSMKVSAMYFARRGSPGRRQACA